MAFLLKIKMWEIILPDPVFIDSNSVIRSVTLDALLNFANKPEYVLIVGELNAHHNNWHCAYADIAGHTTVIKK